MRIGHGFDVHRFAPRVSEHKPLILGGVTLPDTLSLEAHSDGDVVLHALCDALLGAIGEGDIGRHFPDTDAQYAGVSSVFLLEQVCSLVGARGFSLSNADITVVAQLPKLAPHREAQAGGWENPRQVPGPHPGHCREGRQERHRRY